VRTLTTHVFHVDDYVHRMFSLISCSIPPTSYIAEELTILSDTDLPQYMVMLRECFKSLLLLPNPILKSINPFYV